MRAHDVQNADGVISRLPGVGITFKAAKTVPVDGTVGYAPGCIFLDVNAAAGLQFFINEGTKTSCDFNALVLAGVSLSGLTATAIELNTLSGILATTAELNRAADVSTRVVTHAPADAATLSLTELLHDGKILYVTKTDGLAITLPAPVAGMRFRIVIGATIASASTIKSAAGTQIMLGHALMGNNSDNTVVDWQSIASSTNDTIDLFGTSNSTGGIEGQIITIEALSSTVWFVEIRGDASGTEATPFANTVA